MNKVFSWLLLVLLCLVNASLLTVENFPLLTFLVIWIWGAFGFLLSRWQLSRRDKAGRYAEKREKARLFFSQISLLLIFILAYFHAGILAVLPLIIFIMEKNEEAYLLVFSLAFPQYVSIALKGGLMLLVLCLFSAYLAWQLKQSDVWEARYYGYVDEMTAAYRALEGDRRRMLVEHEIMRENDILSERNRIAREIHDHVGHKLTSSILQVNVLELVVEEENREILASLKETLQEAMAEVRASVHNLHDDSLDIERTLEQMLADYRFCPVHLKVELKNPLSAAYHHAVKSIVREALANTAKHSTATRMDIHLIEGENYYQMLITDNGQEDNKAASSLEAKGERIFSDGKGIGLYTMEDRVLQLGGEITFSKNLGFRIFIRLPLEKGVRGERK